MKLAILLLAALALGLFIGWNVRTEIKFRDWQANTLDNYSFSAGVWCAQMAVRDGHAEFTTNKFYQDNGYAPSGLNHSKILYAARCLAMTNGWPPFNNRIGFVGTEGTP